MMEKSPCNLFLCQELEGWLVVIVYKSLSIGRPLEVSNVCDKYVAKKAHAMFCDPNNELYFTFLKPPLHKFNSINLLFQNEKVDHVTPIDNLESFFTNAVKNCTC